LETERYSTILLALFNNSASFAAPISSLSLRPPRLLLLFDDEEGERLRLRSRSGESSLDPEERERLWRYRRCVIFFSAIWLATVLSSECENICNKKGGWIFKNKLKFIKHLMLNFRYYYNFFCITKMMLRNKSAL
jgi:hypothetical protein